MSDTPKSQQQWEQEWAQMLEHSKTRIAMYIGSPEQGHRNFIREALRLLWQAKVFRRPLEAKIDLAPQQCVVRCHAGPLLRPIQQMFSWGVGRTLAEQWPTERKAYFERIAQEDKEKGKPFSKRRYRYGWRYCFSGPTGPRLEEPSYIDLFARHFLWGIRTNAGLWCEIYEKGWPTGRPFVVADNSSVAMLIMADLDPQWFLGLPYNENDAEKFAAMASHKIKMTPYQRPLPDWTPGAIGVEWHPQNDLLTEASFTTDGMRIWL
jgi:hypothetical protein